MQQGDDPPFLQVGTEVSAKYKGAFCEAKVRKVVRNIKCKVTFKQGLGSLTVTDEQIKGILRVGGIVEARHPDRREYVEATITKIQDCSQYTVVFDDGDITTLRRSALCLKSGRHFNESETLDQLPLTHPEHFGNPVIGGRRGRRSRQLVDDSSDDDADSLSTKDGTSTEKEEHIGKVVCVETSDTKKRSPKETWFPGLVVAPTAQDTVRIRVRDEYLVRSFKDGRYYTVPKKEATEFTRELAARQEGPAVIAALQYLDNDELPTHWDREALFGLSASSNSDSEDGADSESSDDEPIEQKDHFVAQLYKFMDDRGTPLNRGPTIANRDVDLYRLYRAVEKLGGYSRVTSQNQWRAISLRLGFAPVTTSITNLVKQAYKKFLHSFEEFYRKLGCTLIASNPRTSRGGKGRSLIRQRDTPTPQQKAESQKTGEGGGGGGAAAAVSAGGGGGAEVASGSGADGASTSTAASTSVETKVVAPSVSPSVMIGVVEKAQKGVRGGLSKVPKEIADVIESSLSEKLIPQSSKSSTSDVIIDASADSESVGGDSVSVICDSSSDVEVTAVSKPPPSVSAANKTKTKTKDVQKKSTTEKSGADDKTVKVKRKSAGRPRLADKVVEDKTSDSDDKDKKDKPEAELQNTRSRSKDDFRSKQLEGVGTPERRPQKGGESRERGKKTEPDPDRRRGRKRRDTDPPDKNESIETIEPSTATNTTTPPAPSSTAPSTTTSGGAPKIPRPSVGDKLKVYYHESKVTYEAKVIEAEGDMFLVHYTGWNTRYDEWVNRDRIAENLSACTKAKRMKAGGAGKTSSSKRGRGGGNLTLRPPSTSTDSAGSNGGPPGTSGHTTPTPMNVTQSTGASATPQSKSDPASSASSATSPSVSSRTRSPALTPARRVTRQQDGGLSASAGPGDVTRTRGRGRRRTSAQTDLSLQSGSDSDDTSSDTEPELKVLPKRGAVTRTYGADDGGAGKGKRKAGGPPDKKEDGEGQRKAAGKRTPVKKEADDDAGNKAGRDFDLNQIRSELKGFKEVVKAPGSGDEVKSDIGVLDDKTGVIDVCLSLDAPSEDIEIKLEEIIKVEMTPEKLSPNADVYEFKEPEPFEFESRKPSSEEKKKRGVCRLFEDMPELKADKSPKKKITPKLSNKDSDCDASPPAKRGKKTKKIVSKDLIDFKDDVKSDEEISAPKLTPQKNTEDSFSRLSVPSFGAPPQETVLPVLDDQFGIFADLGSADECVDRIISGHGASEGDEPGRIFMNIRQDDSISLDDKNRTRNSASTTLSSTIHGLQPDSFLKLDDSNKTKADSSSDDDNINATIKRVISQSLTDDSQSSDNTTLKPETSAIFQSTFDKKLITTDPQKLIRIEGTIKSDDDMEIDPETLTIMVDNAITERPKLESIFDRTNKQMSDVRNIHSMANKVLKAMTEGSSSAKTESENLEQMKAVPKIDDVKKDIKILKTILPFEVMKKETAKTTKAESKILVEEKVSKILDVPPIIPVKETEIKITPEPVAKNNVTELIQKLESSMQHKVSVLGTSYTEDSDDSTDSEQRLVIDKLSDEEETSQQSESASLESPEIKIEKTPENEPVPILQTPIAIKSDSKTPSETIVAISEKSEKTSKSSDDQPILSGKDKSEEPESNISLLLCEETIPGSPAPVNSLSEVEQQTGAESPKQKPKSAKNLQMELPFASAVGIGGKPVSSSVNTSLSTTSVNTSVTSNSNTNMVFKVMSGTAPISSSNIGVSDRKDVGFVHPGGPNLNTTPGSEKSPLSTSESGTLSDVSPRDDRIGSPPVSRKSQRTISSTESEMGAPDVMSPGESNIGPGQNEQNAPEEETRPNPVSSSKKHESADIENISPKKRRRSRKASECEPSSNSNTGSLPISGTLPSGCKRSRRGIRTTSDSDNNSGDQFGPRPVKYNFYVHLDSSLDSNQRIGVLLQKLTELRKTYNNVKSELACIDRRRKKLRRREREVIKAARAEVV